MNESIINKPDFTDLEAIALKIHTKADTERVLELTQAIKRETVDNLAKLKKDNKNKKIKELDELCKSTLDETKKIAERVVKLAGQFDRELVDRDSKHKKQQS